MYIICCLFFLSSLNVCNGMLHGCVDMQRPSQIQDLLSRSVTAVLSTFCFYAIRYPSDFRCIRVLNSALVGCARYTLGFRFPKKYAHQNDPLNQGNLHELKLRLKIVRYPGIEVGTTLAQSSDSSILIGRQFFKPNV